jgi:hypothetical protein
MRCRVLNAALLGMLIPLAGYAGDAAKPRREIVKQPVYKSSTPLYALLVFGKKADRTMWVVIDGDTLYADRNGNGDLTDPEDAIPNPSAGHRWSFQIDNPTTPKDSKKRDFVYFHRNSLLGGFRFRRGGGPWSYQFIGYGKNPRIDLGKTPAMAPVLRFDGPLSLGRYGDIVTVPRKPNGSVRTSWLRVTISTPIAGTHHSIDSHCRCTKDFGPLVGEFEYRDAGGNSIRVKHELKQSG